MHELPYLNGQELGDPLTSKAAAAYCNAIAPMLFDGSRLPDYAERYLRRIFLVGFLLYTNAHLEFIRFLREPSTWEFLSAVSGRYFHVFSVRLDPVCHALAEHQQEAMIDLFEAFKLGDSPGEPHLVLAALNVEFEIDLQDSMIYRGELTEFAAFQLGSEEMRDYIGILRRALNPVGKALRGMPTRPVKTATRAIRRVQLGSLMRLVLRDLFQSEMSAKLAGAWRLLNWRPSVVS